MGIFFEYFRAVDDETATAAHALRNGVLRGDPPFDAVDATGVFYDPHVAQLVAAVLDVPYSREYAGSTVLWPPVDTPPPVDETSIWLTDPGINRLPDRTRDVLAACSADDVPRVAARWRQELGFLSQDEAEQRVRDLAALARRAQQAKEGFYCWSAM